MNGHFMSRVMWGLFIIVIGIALMLRQSGVLAFDIGELISHYWPVFVLFLGFQGLAVRLVSGEGSYWGGFFLTLVGFIFLGRNMGWFSWSIGDLMQFVGPLIVILIGIRMIMRPRKRSRPSSEGEWKAYRHGPADDPVPPAPPLHPDPTKPFEEFEDGDKEAPAADLQRKAHRREPQGDKDKAAGVYREERPYNGKNGDHERQNLEYELKHHEKMHRLARKAERIREKMEHRTERHYRRHGRHDRTEWWNYDPEAQNRSGFIGDIYVGHDYWELKPMNISHFIGDTVLDLTKAQIPPGETRIHISSFIGDVKVFLPNDSEVGVNVVSSAFIGDVAVLERKEGGIFKNMNVVTPYFHETDKKVKLVVSTFIGDVRVTKVG